MSKDPAFCICWVVLEQLNQSKDRQNSDINSKRHRLLIFNHAIPPFLVYKVATKNSLQGGSMNIDKKKVSYVLGQSIGGDFRRQGFEVDTDVFYKSFVDAMEGKEPSMSVGEMQLVFQQFQQYVQERNQVRKQELASVNLEKGAAFLAENRKTPGVVETSSGLQYKVIVEGKGEKPKVTDTVETHYEGRTLDGKVFDSSYRRGTTTSFPLNSVIKGWTEALQLMNVGSKWELYIPSDLAYGVQGSGGTIEPHATLVFTVELIGIK